MKEITLTQGKVALVSDHQFERANQFKWHALRTPHGKYYAVKNGKRTPQGREPQVYLHRYLMGVTDSHVEVDHRDGDGLNCQDENMRICRHVENMHNFSRPKNNTTGFKGVSFNKERTKYQVNIRVGGRQISIGLFSDIVLAAKAYDKAALQYHGAFAKLNFP